MAGNPGVFVRMTPDERTLLREIGEELVGRSSLPQDERDDLVRYDGEINISGVVRHLLGAAAPMFKSAGT